MPPATPLPAEVSTEPPEPPSRPDVAVVATVGTAEMVFHQDVTCEFGDDDYGRVEATGETGAEFLFVLDGTASRILIADELSEDIEAPMTYVESQADGTLYVEAAPPDMTITISCP